MKYVAYYRLSKQGARQTGLGIEAQKQIVNHFYQPVREYVEIKSGKDIQHRIILQQAIQYCLDNNCILVVAKVDRLSRNVDDCRYVLEAMKGNLACCDIPGTVDKFTLTLYAAFAERERELISLRTSQALQAKVRREGEWRKASRSILDGTAQSKGTDAIKQKAISNQNNQRAAAFISTARTSGQSLKEICNQLNENNFKTSTGCRFSLTQVQRLAIL